MSGANVADLLKSTADVNVQPKVIRGYISTNRAAPTGFPVPDSEDNLLWVISPAYSLDRPIGPCWWNADHGASLPAQGTEVVVIFDDQEIPTVIFWVGAHS